MYLKQNEKYQKKDSKKMAVFVTPFASKQEGMKDLLVLLGKKKEAKEIEREYQRRKLLGPWVRGIEKIAEQLQDNFIDRLVEVTSYYCERSLLKGIREFSQALREQNFLVGAVTSDPQFMMDVVKEDAKLDFAYGTELEFKSKIATGKVLKKLDRYDKAELIKRKAQEFNIPKQNIITIGESSIVHLPAAKKSNVFIGFDPRKETLSEIARTIVTDRNLRKIFFGK